MSIEMDAGLQIFAEESKELLESIEDILLQLEANPDDEELVNALFRAVHTIKGSSGLFGFDHVVEFTHRAESVMEKVRDGEVSISNELLTVLLESRDHIAELVKIAFQGETELSVETAEQGKVLSSQLDHYLADHPQSQDETSESEEKVTHDESGSNEPKVENQYWHISLRFGNDVFRHGMDPLSFIRYLETIGDIVSLATLDEQLPDPDKMDAENCYLGFEISLNSKAEKEEIEDVFEFVQDECVIHILPPHSRVGLYVQLMEQLPEDNYKIGEILTSSGALTQRELQEILQEQQQQRDSIEDGSEETVPAQGELAVKQQVIESQAVDAAVNKQQQIKQHKEEENQVVRVSANKLEELINLVGELVISGANTDLLARESGNSQLVDATENLAGLVEEIRDTALGLRMVPIGGTFNRYRRVVREVSRDLNKQIDLIISGGDTELDKTVVDKIADPLMHLVRNAIDHGIELPAERAQSGKPAKGSIHLNAFHDSGSIVIEITDDGRGLSKEKILAKALEKGLINENHSLTDNEIYRLIFEPGFSTAEQVTNISGRGVGMDVVRRNIDALRGQVDVNSTPGKGSTISIRLPLTLAIIDGFLVQVGKSSYVIPLDMVDECVEFSEVAHDAYEHSKHINLRGEILPYVHLAETFGQDTGQKTARENIVVARFGNKKAGLVVDELLGEHQTVIKPLGSVFQNIKGLSGATILGSGEVAMIVDVPALVANASMSNRNSFSTENTRTASSV